MRRIIFCLGLIVLAFMIFWQSLFLFDFSKRSPDMIFGVNFSPLQTDHLGIDGREVYRALLDDLGVKHLRLGAYWNRIEKTEGVYDFSELDYYMDEAAKRQAKIILTTGQRIQRWPECHDPQWLKKQDKQNKLDKLITETVNRYKDHPALEFWQIENEPFLLAFGKCEKISSPNFKKEIDLVKKLDPTHPTISTDSGELASWLRTAPFTDYFGSTVYRLVLSPYLGYISHEPSIPAAQYRLRSFIAGKPIEKVFLIEVQAEPWTDRGLRDVPIQEQFNSMDLNRFKKTAQFAKKTGFPRSYMWGAEWWYWLRQNGHPEFWDFAKTLF